MPNSLGVNIAVEGDLDEALLKKVLNSIGIEVVHVYGKRGKDYLRENIQRYNQAAQYRSWVVLVDLDNDAECAPPFIASWLRTKNPNLQLRIAVRTIEAWLLADRGEIARFLSVSEQRIPLNVEDVEKPKTTLINVVRHSRNKSIRTDIIPREWSTATQGPGYTSRLIDFTIKRWDPERAASNAPSLERSMNSLLRWKMG